jgi:hypothetical protein
MNFDLGAVIIVGVIALVVVLVALMNRGRLKSLLIKAPGVSAKIENQVSNDSNADQTTPGVVIDDSKLKRSEVEGLEGSRLAVSKSKLSDSTVKINEKSKKSRKGK